MQEDQGGPDITRLLREWRSGSGEALQRLIPLVCDELHALASRYLSHERRENTLQTTALVNEAYLKLAGQRDVDWQNRAHFGGTLVRLGRWREARKAYEAGLKVAAGLETAPVEPVDAALMDRLRQGLTQVAAGATVPR